MLKKGCARQWKRQLEIFLMGLSGRRLGRPSLMLGWQSFVLCLIGLPWVLLTRRAGVPAWLLTRIRRMRGAAKA